MKYILGSGLVALLAKSFLPNDWTIIPHNKSRFYTKDIVVDNFLVYNERMRPILNDTKMLKTDNIYQYRSAWSYGGDIISEYNQDLADIWSYKIFGLNPPSHFKHTLPNRMSLQVFDCRLNTIYNDLYDKYGSSFSTINVSDIESISQSSIHTSSSTLEHSGIVSTYPIHETELAEDLTVVTGNSGLINFEGHNQLWVVDPAIPFFKVTNIRSDGTYNFMFSGNITDPISSIRSIVPDFKPSIFKVLKKAIPKGERVTGSGNITPIGATAENDYSVDISTSIMRILNYSDRP